MAILVAVAGAVIGNALGIGGSLGWTIGAFIGTMIFGGNKQKGGPRLGDLTVTASTYGNMRAIGFGTIRMAGNIIWCPGLKQHSHKASAFGKGGVSGGGQTTYTYSVSMAIAFGEGVAQDMLRLWANGKLIFDKRGVGTNVKMKGLKFRFYPGNETQMPDPIITNPQGTGIPAFRNTCYIVIENFPLQNFGNAVPNFTAEISYSTNASNNAIPGSPVGVLSGTQLAVDFTRGFAYTETGFPDGTLRVFSLSDMVETRQQTSDAIFAAVPTTTIAGGFMAVAPSTGDIIVTDIGSNTCPISSIDPNTLTEIARFGYAGDGLDGGPMTSSRFLNVTNGVFITVNELTSGPVDYYLCQTTFNNLGILKCPGMTYVWDTQNFPNSINEVDIQSITPGFVGIGYGEGHVISRANTSGSTPLDIWTITVLDSGTASIANMCTLTVAEIFPGDTISSLPETTMLNPGKFAVYDSVDDSVIFFAQQGALHTVTDINGHKTSVHRCFWIKVRDGAIVWRTEVDPSGQPEAGNFSNSTLQGSTFGYIVGHRGFLIDTGTGAVLVNGTGPDYGPDNIQPSVGADGFYDSDTQTFVSLAGATSVVVNGRWFFGRAQGNGAAIGDIVTNICERVGLEADQIDVASLSGLTVPGYELGQQMAARDAIAPLSTLYFFDGVESDSVLKFILRGMEPIRTIYQDDLAVVDTKTNEVLTESRLQEVDLPASISLRYMDISQDYQAGTQSYQRIRNPVPTMFSANTTTLDYSIALNVNFAIQSVQELVFTAWSERITYAIKTAWENIDLDPTDVIQIQLNDGTIFTERIVNTEMSVGYDLTIKGLNQEEGQYSALTLGYSGEGAPTQTVSGAVATKLILLDSPLLRDSDEAPSRSYDPMYYFMGGFSNSGWSSGALYKSSDASTYVNEDQVTTPMTWGTTLNALGDPGSPFTTDYRNTLKINLVESGATLESISYLQMMNGANAAALIKANGEIEIIQFQNLTLNVDGTITLDTLTRGRRGTDTMAYNHTAGETFVFLDTAAGGLFALSIAEIGVVRYYKGVGAGELLEDAPQVTETSTGRALKPYAPVNQKVALAGGNDLNLSWVRRTRVAGAWQDVLSDVPLNEDSEQYAIDIYNGSSIVRTVTGLSSPTYTYSAANQAIDGFTPPLTSLKMAVYQISAQVGRGFGKVLTVNVQ